MAEKLTRADFYFLIYIHRYWRLRELCNADDEEIHLRFRTRVCGLDPATDGDFEKMTTLLRKMLTIIRSYPPEESSDEDSEIGAGSEGDDSSSEQNESGLGNN